MSSDGHWPTLEHVAGPEDGDDYFPTREYLAAQSEPTYTFCSQNVCPMLVTTGMACEIHRYAVIYRGETWTDNLRRMINDLSTRLQHLQGVQNNLMDMLTTMQSAVVRQHQTIQRLLTWCDNAGGAIGPILAPHIPTMSDEQKSCARKFCKEHRRMQEGKSSS